MPFVVEVDNLKKDESKILQQINESQQELRIAFLYDDYWKYKLKSD